MDIVFSIIIPTYNRCVSLEKLLLSLLSLKDELKGSEIIIIDDGSYDETYNIVSKFQTQFNALSYFYQKNRGPASARNKGAKQAKGSYLIFLDDDCLFPQGCIDSIHNFYRTNTNYVGVGIRTINKYKGIFTEYNQRLGDYLIEQSRVSPSTYEYVSSRCYSFVRDSFWKLGGHDEEYIWPAAEDRDLCLRMKIKKMNFGYMENIAVINADNLLWKRFIKQNFLYGLGAGLLLEKNDGIIKASKPAKMMARICNDENIFKRIGFFFVYSLAQVSFLAGFLSFKTNFNYQKRPPSVFLPRYVVLIEIVKNFLLGIPLMKWIKKHFGSLTTGEEILSIGYMVNLARQTMDVYKVSILKVYQDEDWLNNKKILEIGPGSHLSIPLCFIAEGADQVFSIDQYGEVKYRHKEMEVYQKVISKLQIQKQERARNVLRKFESKKGARLCLDNLSYLPDVPIDSPKVLQQLQEGYFDAIVSFNTMEHVKEVRMAFENMKRLLKKDGILIHRIDAASHYQVLRYTKNKLSQLVFSDRLFNLMFSNRNAPTRRLMNTYIEIARQTGFHVDHCYVDEVAESCEVDSSFSFLDPKYKQSSKEELSKVGFVLVAVNKGL